jgi:hypothetical protein
LDFIGTVYAVGIVLRINPSSQIAFSWWKPTNGKKKRKQDYFPIEGVYNVDVSPFFFVMQKECLF